ncbi:aggrecan core protein-like [Lineus longissimus]|uniref:aggrecan core protein-like n=1 Tax=Lineus longissimus TaxID=88925 RepID=UPI002B4DD954
MNMMILAVFMVIAAASNVAMAFDVSVPVINLVQSSRGRYQIKNLAEAQQVCKAYAPGMRVATPAELMAAFKIGYERCSCGYLSDGRASYVMQKWRPGCAGRGFTTCGYRGSYNTYCTTGCPILSVEKYGQRYNVRSLADADATCKKYDGMQVATYDQVNTARTKDNYEKCACGYMKTSSGRPFVGYPMLKWRKGCAGAGMANCRTIFGNVFCVNPWNA